MRVVIFDVETSIALNISQEYGVCDDLFYVSRLS